MSQDASSNLPTGFCIYMDTVFQGPIPTVSDGDDKYVIFETERDAQKEIVEYMIIRLRQFLDGKRDYEEAIAVQEYVVPVTVHPDGVFTDEAGNCFGPKID